MNGQTNNNEPMRPDFGGLHASSNNNDSGNSIPPPVPLSDRGIGFSNEPVFSSWSPSMIPVPGPIAESAPQSTAPITTSPAPIAPPSVAPISPVAPAPAVDAEAIPYVLPTQTNPVSPAVFAPSSVPTPISAIPTAPPDQTSIAPMAAPYVAPINPSPIISTPAVAPQTASFIAPMPTAPTSQATPSPIPVPNPALFTTTPAFAPAPSSPTPVIMPATPMPSPIVPAPISQEATPQVAPASPVQAPTFVPATPMPTPTPAPIVPTPISQESPPQVVPPSPAPFITQPYIVAPSATQASFAPPSLPATPQPVSSPRPVVSNLPTEGHAPIPAPNPTQYEIQTLASDMATLKASGGADITPQTFIPGGVTGEEVFNPAAVVPVKPKSNKKILIIIGAIILLALIVAIGFFFIKPLFMTPPADLTYVPATPDTEVEQLQAEPTRESFFVSPADTERGWNIGNVDIANLRSAFQPLAGEAMQDGAMIELNITHNNNPILFSEFLTTMLPDKNIAGIAATFEDDFTLFVYRDGINDLPGFIAKVRATTTPETLATFSSALEASPNLKNFYATDPGVMSAFRAGAIQGDPIKYAPFAAGYAFNHGWFKDALGANYLVVSSSHKGMVRAIELARF